MPVISASQKLDVTPGTLTPASPGDLLLPLIQAGQTIDELQPSSGLASVKFRHQAAFAEELVVTVHKTKADGSLTDYALNDGDPVKEVHDLDLLVLTGEKVNYSFSKAGVAIKEFLVNEIQGTG